MGQRERFLHALNFCMLLPGPEAQQLTIYLGWLLHRVRGGVVAGVLFVLPGALTVLVLSMIYVTYQQAMAVTSIFFGVKAAVLAIVTTALWRLARHRPGGRRRPRRPLWGWEPGRRAGCTDIRASACPLAPPWPRLCRGPRA